MNKRKLSIIIVIALALVARLLIVVYHGNSDYEADSYLHFLQAKYLFYNWPTNIGLLYNVWAKPLYLLVFSGWLQLFGNPMLGHAKLLNLVLGVLTSGLVYSVARKLGYDHLKSITAVIFTSFSFLFLRATTSVLTEPLSALMLLGSFLLLLNKKYFWANLLLGILVLVRLEIVMLFPVWLFAVLVLTRASKQRVSVLKLVMQALLLLIPILAWNFVGFLQTGSALYLVTNGYPLKQGLFSFGYPWHYIFTSCKV